MIQFRQDIQGLRAIAVLAVMVFHYDRSLLPGGFIGVDIFFVISGYLITAILLKHKTKDGFSLWQTLKLFYIGRVKRIAPAYYVLLIVVTLISAVIFISKDFGFYLSSLKRSIWFFSNYYFADFGDYFAPKSDELPLLHTWSLAIEMQFYFFYPFLILLVPKKWLKLIVPTLVVVLFIVASYQLRSGQAQEAYYGLHARVPEFLIGGCLVIFASQFRKIQFVWLPIMGAVLVGLSFFFINEKTPFPGVYAIPAVVGTALIMMQPSAALAAKFLSLPFLVWVGAISYSLYLWHWPILAFFRYINSSYSLTFVQSICYWGGAFMFASASYYWVEQRFRSKKNSSRIKNIAPALTIAIITFCAVVIAPSVNKKVVPKLPIELTRYADPNTICHGKIIGDCIRGDRSSKEKPILVLGDSHAAMLNHFFDVVGNELNLSFRIITGSSCLNINGFNYKKLADWASKECKIQIEHAEKVLRQSERVILAGMWSYHNQDSLFISSVENWLSHHPNKKIFLFSDVPSLKEYNFLRSHRLSYLGLPLSPPSFDESVAVSNLEIKKLSGKFPYAHYINLLDTDFFNKLNGEKLYLNYFDGNHLNQMAAVSYARYSMEKIKEMIKQ